MTPWDPSREAARRALLRAAAVVPHTDADGLAAVGAVGDLGDGE